MRERHLEERVAGAPLVADPGEEVARLPVVLERLLVGVEGPRRVARLQQVVDRLLRLVGLAEVPGEQREDFLGESR